MTRLLRYLLSLCLLATLPLAHAEKLSVIASFSILADITRQVGGERVEVSTLVGANQDAHVYQPTPGDVRRVAQAKVFVFNGLGFEGWLTRLERAASFKGTRIEASRGVRAIEAAHDHDHDHGHGHGARDPHAWHDLRHVQRYVDNIAQGLSAADPAGKTYYQQRATSYKAQLAELDQWAAKQFAAIPAASRKVLTGHDAFAYLGARYQIRFLAPQGVSTESAASAKTVAALIRQVRKENIRAVFIENLGDRKLLDQLTQETGARVGGTLYSDALSPAGGPAADFVALYRHNVNQLLSALRK